LAISTCRQPRLRKSWARMHTTRRRSAIFGGRSPVGTARAWTPMATTGVLRRPRCHEVASPRLCPLLIPGARPRGLLTQLAAATNHASAHCTARVGPLPIFPLTPAFVPARRSNNFRYGPRSPSMHPWWTPKTNRRVALIGITASLPSAPGSGPASLPDPLPATPTTRPHTAPRPPGTTPSN
jgi:hypothetical protein